MSDSQVTRKDACGLLRDSVRIERRDDFLTLNYAFYKLKLPAAWVNECSARQKLLDRKMTVDEAFAESSTRDIARVLASYGCFLPRFAKDAYKYSEVLQLFNPIKNEWYAFYYGHETWNALAQGRAGLNALVAWLLFNYHISRAAGVVAARLVESTTDYELREFFRNDAIEEYWHCDAFYHIDSPRVQVSFSESKRYLPLPAALAFEQQTLFLAERDPLAHIMVAYFQESTILFKGQAESFHQKVEKAYGLSGFFGPWFQHVAIDIAEGHAQGLEELFAIDRSIARQDLVVALTRTWIAIEFINEGLTAVKDEDEAGARGIHLRLPYDPSDHVNNLWLHRLFTREGLEKAWERKTVTGIIDGLAVAFLRAHSELNKSIPVRDKLYLQEVMADSALKALARSKAHDHIVASGRIAQAFNDYAQKTEQLIPETLWTVGLGNYLKELAHSPVDWMIAMNFLLKVLPDDGLPWQPEGWESHKFRHNKILQEEGMEPANLARWVTQLGQLAEITRKCLAGSKKIIDLNGSI